MLKPLCIVFLLYVLRPDSTVVINVINNIFLNLNNQYFFILKYGA